MVKKVSLLVLAAFLASLIALVLPAQTSEAASIYSFHMGCRSTSVWGQTEVDAPYVRIQVVTANDLSNVLAVQVVPVHWNGFYSAYLWYPRQPRGIALILSVGEWDGQNYLKPATLMGATCEGW